MKPLTRRELDASRCTVEHEHGEECGGGSALFFHSRCHPGAGSEVEYDGGLLTIRCNECKLFVAQIRVAAGNPPPPPPRRTHRRR